MRKLLWIGLSLVGVVVIVAVIGIVLLVSNLDKIVKSVIETAGSEATATTVTVRNVELSLSSGEGTLEGLTIGNPAGFDSEYAFQLDRTRIGLDLASISSDVIVVREIVVDGPRLFFEQKEDGNNLDAILENLGGDSGSSDDAAASEKKLIIQTFRFINGEATVLVEQLDNELTAKIPDVVVHGIGEKTQGATVEEVARQLLEPLLAQSIAAAKGAAKAALEERLEEEKGKMKQDLEERGQKKIDDLKGRLAGN
jgi:uncharacterized protein involved in outer membrane biogenesis